MRVCVCQWKNSSLFDMDGMKSSLFSFFFCFCWWEGRNLKKKRVGQYRIPRLGNVTKQISKIADTLCRKVSDSHVLSLIRFNALFLFPVYYIFENGIPCLLSIKINYCSLLITTYSVVKRRV